MFRIASPRARAVLAVLALMNTLSYTKAGALTRADGGELNPAFWGVDHAGQPVPEYITGDQCLFCHRLDIGPKWLTNPHHQTIRLLEPEQRPKLKARFEGAESIPQDATLAMGRRQVLRVLRRDPGYGKLQLYSSRWLPPPSGIGGRLRRSTAPQGTWLGDHFQTACAGCHTTGFDSQALTFSSISIGCFSCHGNVTLEHTKDTSFMILSRKRKDPARVIVSLCGQCHLRAGRSRSTGLPWPNNFIAGDNLFRDLDIPFAERRGHDRDRIEAHILENTKSVVLHGDAGLSCVSCHDIHLSSHEKHEELASRPLCYECHIRSRPKSELRTRQPGNPLCEY